MLKRIVITTKGKGYGKEAVALIKKIVFEELSATKLTLEVFADNTRAQQLYADMGFCQEEYYTDKIMKDNKKIPCFVYSIFAP